MQLTEIRINLCGPVPSQGTLPHAPVHPRICQPLSVGPCGGHALATDNLRGGRLRAFCSLTFDNTFVVRDVKLIEGNDGLFLAMPSRKLCDRCRRCSEKNHLRARFCNHCGSRLDENRFARGGPVNGNGNGAGNHRGMFRPKLHADIAHPINAACRLEIERRVLMAYLDELERSKLPGYVAPNLDGDYSDFDENDAIDQQNLTSTVRLRPTGTA
jgi:DNA-binding cell septation regulator SpoVG